MVIFSIKSFYFIRLEKNRFVKYIFKVLKKVLLTGSIVTRLYLFSVDIEELVVRLSDNKQLGTFESVPGLEQVQEHRVENEGPGKLAI